MTRYPAEVTAEKAIDVANAVGELCCPLKNTFAFALAERKSPQVEIGIRWRNSRVLGKCLRECRGKSILQKLQNEKSSLLEAGLVAGSSCRNFTEAC